MWPTYRKTSDLYLLYYWLYESGSTARLSGQDIKALVSKIRRLEHNPNDVQHLKKTTTT